MDHQQGCLSLSFHVSDLASSEDSWQVAVQWLDEEGRVEYKIERLVKL